VLGVDYGGLGTTEADGGEVRSLSTSAWFLIAFYNAKT
jgi:hypothetical protein